MNIIKTLTLTTALLGLGAVQTVAFADSTEANCKFFKKGELREKASSPCRFSQRQGFVDITLRNGRSFSLSPANQANHFKDQKGNKVVRTVRGNGNHKYKWEHKRVVVSFDPNSGSNAYCWQQDRRDATTSEGSCLPVWRRSRRSAHGAWLRAEEFQQIRPGRILQLVAQT
ncbi:hypothetical protein [Thiolapillus sp.]|uniref:hypothetical protein n=1 Tax=Thiolapillus sp. TaxID=2017437 RepID=UPI003AF7B0D3